MYGLIGCNRDKDLLMYDDFELGSTEMKLVASMLINWGYSVIIVKISIDG